MPNLISAGTPPQIPLAIEAYSAPSDLCATSKGMEAEGGRQSREGRREWKRSGRKGEVGQG